MVPQWSFPFNNNYQPFAAHDRLHGHESLKPQRSANVLNTLALRFRFYLSFVFEIIYYTKLWRTNTVSLFLKWWCPFWVEKSCQSVWSIHDWYLIFDHDAQVKLNRTSSKEHNSRAFELQLQSTFKSYVVNSMNWAMNTKCNIDSLPSHFKLQHLNLEFILTIMTVAWSSSND